MNNPPANAISPELREEFSAKLNEILSDDDIWALIVTGAGTKFFVAGAYIPALLKLDRQSGLQRIKKAALAVANMINTKGPLVVRAVKRVSSNGL